MDTPNDFPEAYQRFMGPIRAKCRRMLGQSAEADDVAQEAFVKLWQVGPAVDGTTETRTVMAWLYLTSTRLALDAMRRTRASSSNEDAVAPLSCGASPEEAFAARATIHALCNSIDAVELHAALLARVDGLPQAEAAMILGVSERTVRRLLERFDERSAHLRKEFSQ
jgi:RNA polymerase sigma-70 factor (ECF subfamily)